MILDIILDSKTPIEVDGSLLTDKMGSASKSVRIKEWQKEKEMNSCNGQEKKTLWNILDAGQ